MDSLGIARRFTAGCMVGASALFLSHALVHAAPVPIDFARDVRPILSRHCFACHGPDPAHRKAGFRIDNKNDAFAALDEGKRALVAGQPQQSEVFARLVHSDPDERMPPKDTGKSLSGAEIVFIATR